MQMLVPSTVRGAGPHGKRARASIISVTGSLSDLTTTDQTDLVSAINEVDGDVGALSGLTHAADDLVAAINAIDVRVTALEGA